MLLVLFAAAFAADLKHLTVDDALAALEQHNPNLQRAGAQLDEARGASLVALSAILPTVTGTGSYVRNNKEVTLDLGQLFDALAALSGQPAPDTAPLVLQPLDAVSGTATVRVPLVSASAWAAIAGANDRVAAATASVDATSGTLRGAALQAFWAEAAAEGFVGAQEASAQRARDLAARMERAVNAGTATQLGLLQAQTEVARREGDLLQMRANLDKARIAVGTLLGEDAPVAVDLPAPVAAPVDADGLVEEAWSTRAEIAAGTRQLEAAHADLLAAKLGVVPTVAGSFSAFASTEPYTTGDKTGWRGTVDLSWPLVQGGYRIGAIERANGAIAEAEASLAAVKLQVSQQVRNAAADLGVARARLELAGRQRQLAEQAAAAAQRAFDGGTLDTTGLLDALDRLDGARVTELDATARVGMANAALQAATGRW